MSVHKLYLTISIAMACTVLQAKPTLPLTFSKDTTKQIHKEMEKELTDILSWWMTHMVDHQNGGFYGRMDGKNELHPNANKGVILNTRILWTFAAAARQTENSNYQKIADRAYAYIIDYFIDQENGGVYWMLDQKGQVVEGKKQIYAQAFAIYALAEYYLLTQNETALEQAMNIFNLIEKHSYDPENTGYLDAFDQNWVLTEESDLSDKGLNALKTMNTHLHVLEAYTNLYRAFPTPTVGKALRGLIDNFLEIIINPGNAHLHMFFDKNWKVLSQDISYGHDIECSWLLVEAAEVLHDPKVLKEVEPIAIKMAQATLKEGLDQHGALIYERHPDGHVNDALHWWPQAETVIGFWNAWQLTHDPAFEEAAQNCWAFIKKYIKDQEHGEWLWGVDPKGRPMLGGDKAGPWKAPYHNGRMCLEIMRRTTAKSARH